MRKKIGKRIGPVPIALVAVLRTGRLHFRRPLADAKPALRRQSEPAYCTYRSASGHPTTGTRRVRSHSRNDARCVHRVRDTIKKLSPDQRMVVYTSDQDDMMTADVSPRPTEHIDSLVPLLANRRQASMITLRPSLDTEGQRV